MRDWLGTIADCHRFVHCRCSKITNINSNFHSILIRACVVFNVAAAILYCQLVYTALHFIWRNCHAKTPEYNSGNISLIYTKDLIAWKFSPRVDWKITSLMSLIPQSSALSLLTPPIKPINQRQRQRQEQQRRGKGGEGRVEGEQQSQVEDDLVSDVGQQPDDDAKR